eukprot:3741568-Rhodomonas_salina.1
MSSADVECAAGRSCGSMQSKGRASEQEGSAHGRGVPDAEPLRVPATMPGTWPEPPLPHQSYASELHISSPSRTMPRTHPRRVYVVLTKVFACAFLCVRVQLDHETMVGAWAWLLTIACGFPGQGRRGCWPNAG